MIARNPPVEICDKLWMLGSNEYPLYLYRGDAQGTLFEGGIGATGPLVAEQLAALEIAPAYVRQLVVTHAHPDHVMAVPALRKLFPDVAVLASPAAARALASDKALAFFAKLDGALTGALLSEGMIEARHRPEPWTEASIPIDREIVEGDVIDVDDGRAFQVLETPGHSECSLSFFDPSGGILIISDATGYFLPERDFWWPNYFSDYGAYVASMERLAALRAETLCLSHNGAIQGADDVADYFRDVLTATREYHQRILDQARAGRTPREIGALLGAEVYEYTQRLPLDFFQKNCALLAKLSLRHENIAEPPSS